MIYRELSTKIETVKTTEHYGNMIILRSNCDRGEEGQSQQFLVPATFSSFSRPSHLEILVLSLVFLSV